MESKEPAAELEDLRKRVASLEAEMFAAFTLLNELMWDYRERKKNGG